MTTQEIKDLIASKIAGQGSAVDAGSALPEILNGIVDALANVPSFPPEFIVDLGEMHVRRMEIPAQLGRLVERALYVKVNGLLFPRVAFYNGFADTEGYVDSVFGLLSFDDTGALDSYTIYKLVLLDSKMYEITVAEA